MNSQLETEMSQDLEQSKKYKQFIARNDRIKYKIIFFISFIKAFKTETIDPSLISIKKFKAKWAEFNENKADMNKA